MARVHAERFLKELDSLLFKYNARITQDENQDHINVLAVDNVDYEIPRLLGIGSTEIIQNLTESESDIDVLLTLQEQSKDKGGLNGKPNRII